MASERQRRQSNVGEGEEMKWKPIKKITSDMPKDKSFLVWIPTAPSGISVFEAMLDEYCTEIMCPATFDVFWPCEKDPATHWRPMVKLPKRDYEQLHERNKKP